MGRWVAVLSLTGRQSKGRNGYAGLSRPDSTRKAVGKSINGFRETNLRNWAVLFPLRAQLAKVFGVCLPHMQRISVVVICMASVDAGGPLADEPDMK